MKNRESKLKKLAANTLANVAKKSAVKSANSTCDWWNYQEKLPADVKKLRKL